MTTIRKVKCFVNCDYCECKYDLKEITNYAGRLLCPDCLDYEQEREFEENYDCCDNCQDSYFVEDMIHFKNGESYCKECHKEYMKLDVCVICRTLQRRMSLKYYDNGDELWCKNCCSEQERFQKEQKKKNNIK